MSTVKLRLAEAPTDVLVCLVDHAPEHLNLSEIATAAAPTDADEPFPSTRRALHLLVELGYAAHSSCGWVATLEGIKAVGVARSGGAA